MTNDLTKNLKKILEEYKVDIDDVLEESVKEVSKKATKELKQYKRFVPNSNRGRRYYKGWTYKIEKSRTSLQSTVYNKLSGLPHLLEHGHAIQNGTGKTKGRVKGYPHVSKVEDVIDREIEAIIRKKVEG